MRNSNVQNNFETNHTVWYELIRAAFTMLTIKWRKGITQRWTAYDDLRLLSLSIPLYQRYDLKVLDITKMLCENWQRLKPKKKIMQQSYKLVNEVYIQNTTLWQVLQYLTQLVVRIYSFSNNRNSGVLVNISKWFNNFSEVVNRAQH